MDGNKWTKEWELEKLENKKLYCELEHKLNFSKRWVTDMPTCRRMTIPMAGPANEENILARGRPINRLRSLSVSNRYRYRLIGIGNWDIGIGIIGIGIIGIGIG